jgi:hypothetical protein
MENRSETLAKVSPEAARRLAHRAGVLPQGTQLHGIQSIDHRKELIVAAFLAAELGMIIDPEGSKHVAEKHLDHASALTNESRVRTSLIPLMNQASA